MIKSGIDKNNFDLTVSPKNDFFRFVNGGWLKANPIPPEETRWGSFSILQKESTQALREILEELQDQEFTLGSLEQKLSDFYATGMDGASLNRDGIMPLNGELAKIDAIADLEGLVTVLAGLHHLGIYPLWVTSIHSDFKNSDMNILYVSQSGLSLPDRDYYLKDDPKSEQIRQKYREYIALVWDSASQPGDSAVAAELIIKMETKLAEESMTRVELRDPEKQYNPMQLEDASGLAPKLDWRRYFMALGLPEVENLVVSQPLFFRRVGQLLEGTTLEQLKTCFRWHLINSSLPYLSDQFVKLHFDFYGTVLTGQSDNKPRWRRVSNVTSAEMPELLGQLYVKKYFSPEAKEKVNRMVDHLTSAFQKRILALDWMTNETKQKAVEKLTAMGRQLCYPNKWRDYSKLEIKRDSYLQNVFRANQFETCRNIAKYGQPVDRLEWHMSPQTVNAYSDFTKNQIVFPAAIMQPPFFDVAVYDAVNYAGMGAVILHEITHGFDDKGSKFDLRGNMNEWWASDDRANFKTKAQMIVDQFDGYFVFDDLHVSGELTLGENIADLGGISIAYDAFQEFLAENGRPDNIDGFTPEELFFIGWAQIWRRQTRDEEQRRLIMIDPHSPSRFRCNGPLSNMSEFYEVFGVKEGDAMYLSPEKRAKVW